MAYSKLFAEMNSTPSHFIKNFTPIDAKLLPPLISMYNNPAKPGAKSAPMYQSVAMKSFSKTNMESFPAEMLPGRGDIIHSQSNEFTNSFIAGAYRDNRMGVAELRKKRIARLKEKQQMISIVQKSLAEDVNKIQRRSARRIRRDVERTRQLQDLQSIASAIIIQNVWRQKIKQIELKRREEQRAIEEEAQLLSLKHQREHDAASLIARAVLKYLAYKYSRISRRLSAGVISVNPDVLSFYNDGHNVTSSMKRYSYNPQGDLFEDDDGSYDANGNDWTLVTPEKSSKDLANHYLNSLLTHQKDQVDGQFITQVMIKTLNESPSNDRLREKRLLEDKQKSLEELELARLRELATIKIQSNVRGIQGRTNARNVRLMRKVFKAWKFYREPKSRRPSGSPMYTGEGATQLDGFGLDEQRPVTPNDCFSASILDMLKVQKQEDLEEESAVAIQCLFRAQRAQQASKKMKQLKAKNMKRKKEETAKAILARIPHEKPDRSCTSAWLQQESYQNKNRGKAVVHGVVDLSKTSRSAFWLHSSEDMSDQRSGLKQTGRDSVVRSSSVKGMLSNGLGPYFKR